MQLDLRSEQPAEEKHHSEILLSVRAHRCESGVRRSRGRTAARRITATTTDAKTSTIACRTSHRTKRSAIRPSTTSVRCTNPLVTADLRCVEPPSMGVPTSAPHCRSCPQSARDVAAADREDRFHARTPPQGVRRTRSQLWVMRPMTGEVFEGRRIGGCGVPRTNVRHIRSSSPSPASRRTTLTERRRLPRFPPRRCLRRTSPRTSPLPRP